MWSQVPAVQVLAWRMLTRLRAEGWTQDLLDMLYLDEDTLQWAQATGEGESEEESVAIDGMFCFPPVVDVGESMRAKIRDKFSNLPFPD